MAFFGGACFSTKLTGCDRDLLTWYGMVLDTRYSWHRRGTGVCMRGALLLFAWVCCAGWGAAGVSCCGCAVPLGDGLVWLRCRLLGTLGGLLVGFLFLGALREHMALKLSIALEDEAARTWAPASCGILGAWRDCV